MKGPASRALGLAAAVLLLVAAGGCVSRPFSRTYPEKQRFLLDVERAEPSGVRGTGVLRIDRVRVARAYEHKTFVYRTGEATFEDDFYNEFFAPPGVLLYEATGRWLARSGLFASVLAAREATRADWILETRVTRLHGDLRDPAAPRSAVEIRFKLLDARSPGLAVVFERLYAEEVAAEHAAEQRASAAAIAAAWSAGVTRIFERLEVDLAAELPALETRRSRRR